MIDTTADPRLGTLSFPPTLAGEGQRGLSVPRVWPIHRRLRML